MFVYPNKDKQDDASPRRQKKVLIDYKTCFSFLFFTKAVCASIQEEDDEGHEGEARLLVLLSGAEHLPDDGREHTTVLLDERRKKR